MWGESAFNAARDGADVTVRPKADKGRGKTYILAQQNVRGRWSPRFYGGPPAPLTANYERVRGDKNTRWCADRAPPRHRHASGRMAGKPRPRRLRNRARFYERTGRSDRAERGARARLAARAPSPLYRRHLLAAG